MTVQSGSADHFPPLLKAGRSPVLDASQLKILRKYGSEHEVSAGEVLFTEGDENYDLVVVLDGEMEIVIANPSRPGDSFSATYGPGQFLGEIGLLTGQHVFLPAVARTDGRILRVPVAQVREVINQEPILSDLILRTFLLRHTNLTIKGAGLTLIGSRFDANTRRLLEVLARNRISSTWLDLEGTPQAEDMLRQLDVPVEELPIVIVPGGTLLKNPTNRALLDALGLTGTHETKASRRCDLLVIGGGPAGLSAAVYGASEGMSTMLAEDTAFGGQAGTSSRIENYLGFPAGLSGEELTARAVLQAQKFGVQMQLAVRAVELSSEAGVHRVTFDDGEVVEATAMIIATGASYNRLPLDRLSDFEGVGIYYAATQMEAKACAGGPVAIVGGGNSAGQAAMYLSRLCPEVHILIRGGSLKHSMSRYLIDQIKRTPRITVRPNTQVMGLVGNGRLEGVSIIETEIDQTSILSVRGLFVFIGARPCTQWLGGQLADDGKGFLVTGPKIPLAQREPDAPTPLLLETSRPGIFCVGDARSGSVKRVAAAIGEGSIAVRLVFDRLQASGMVVGSPAPVAS